MSDLGSSGDGTPRWIRGLYGKVSFLLLAALVACGMSAVVHQQRNAVDTSAAQPSAPPKIIRGPLTETEVTALARKLTPALVDVETEIASLGVGGAGTGILLSPNGDVLTNNHVINGATTVEIVNKGNNKRYKATVLGYDRTHDIAVVRASGASRLATAAIGDSSTVAIGDPVMALGNAGGLGGPPIKAPGKVSGLDKSISTSDELTGSTEQLSQLIQVAADIRPGDSGGPLIDADGRVVGVNTAASVSFKYQTPNGTGFAIPINDAMTIAKTILAGTSTDTVHVGPTAILGIAVTGPATRADGSAIVRPGTQPGTKVVAVAYDSPADKAGLVEGDTITGLDSTAVDSPTALTSLIGRRKPGDRVNLQWIDKAGQPRTGTATLVAGPPA